MYSIRETDLYQPIKKLLEGLGFVVKGEVKGCDIAALRGEELWIVEMKRHFSVNLLYQAMSRLSVTPFVFVAVPRPRNLGKNFKNAKKILKKLELGLVVVSLDTTIKCAEIILSPGESKKVSRNKKTIAFCKEIEGRTVDTPGGSKGTVIASAYREQCIKIVCLLEQTEPLSPTELVRKYGCRHGAGAILQKNYYGWFTRVARGQYVLSAKGWQFLKENSDNLLIIHYREHYNPMET